MSAIYLNGQKLTGADNASNVIAQDVLGLVEQAGDDTTVQALLDEIADRVADKLLTKTAASSLYLPQSVQNVVGCKNLMPVNPESGRTLTTNGITFTVRDDNSISVTGTATADTWYLVNDYRYHPYPVGDYTVSTGAPNNNFAFVVGVYSAPTVYVNNLAYLNTADSKNITIDYNGYDYMCDYLHIKSGVVCNKVIYPMLRPASYKDSTYEPYAKTNRELTAKFDEKEGKIILKSWRSGSGKVYGGVEIYVSDSDITRLNFAETGSLTVNHYNGSAWTTYTATMTQ